MLCSKCSTPVRPIVAVDIDGTLGDYHEHFIKFACDWTGRDLFTHHYYGRQSFRAWFNDVLGVGTDEYRQIKLAYRQGGMKRSMPIRTGARALCWAIMDAGAELWITTTRPYLSLDNIVPDTVAWLKRHEIAYEGMLFDEDKYQVLAERVDTKRVVLVLDDLLEMCIAAEKWLPTTRVVQVTSMFNMEQQYSVTSTLDAATDIALSFINGWKDKHAHA